MIFMNRYSFLLGIGLMFFLMSCNSNSTGSEVSDFDKLYVTLQGTDKVAILNASTLELIEEIDVSSMEGMSMGTTPHYIALDEVNGYWFVSEIMANTIAMYSMEANELIDMISVDEDPAILDIDITSKKLYSSRMMIMNMGGMQMGSETNLVDEILYSSDGMTLINSYDSGSPTPHALSLSDDGSIILTASNTADFLSKIDIASGDVLSVPLDPGVNDIPNLEVNRLKPLEITQGNGYAFISCTAGEWQNINTGEYEDVNGQVQVWDIATLEKIDTYEFNVTSQPWHIDHHPYENKVYVALSGTSSAENSAGIACLSFSDNSLSLEWITYDVQFNGLHGIAISSDGQFVYASGRGDGNVYKLDAISGSLLKTTNLISSGMTRTGGIAITQ